VVGVGVAAVGCTDARTLVPHHRLVHPGAVDIAAQQAPSAVVLGDETIAVVAPPRTLVSILPFLRYPVLDRNDAPAGIVVSLAHASRGLPGLWQGRFFTVTRLIANGDNIDAALPLALRRVFTDFPRIGERQNAHIPLIDADLTVLSSLPRAIRRRDTWDFGNRLSLLPGVPARPEQCN
jgi:hypothetical protein